MNNNYMNFNNNFNNNKNYYNPDKAQDANNLNNKPVRKPMQRKLKPFHFIIISIVVLVLIFLIVFILKNKISSSSNWNSNDIKMVYITNEYDLTSLKGITDSGKIITIKEGNDEYQYVSVYHDKLYYIDANNIVYSIDLKDSNFTEDEIFTADIPDVWGMRVVDDTIYLIGDGTVLCYNISSSKVKTISINTDNNMHFSDDGLYLFYYNSSKNGISRYTISSSSETLIASNKLIIQGLGNMIFLQDESDDSSDVKYFVYSIEDNETTEVSVDLNIAYTYKDKIVYAKDVSILEFEHDEADLLYTFQDDSRVEGIANIVLLGNRLLIAAELPAIDTVEVGNYDYEYYLFDLNSKKLVKLNDDYRFILN